MHDRYSNIWNIRNINNYCYFKWIGIFKEIPNGNTELDFTEEIEVNNFIMKLLAKFYLKSQQKDI